MKLITKSVQLFAAIIVTFLTATVWAGFGFRDPQIPDGEQTTYECRKKGSITLINESVAVKREGQNDFYEIYSQSPELDATIQIHKDTMTILSVDMLKRFEDATINSTLKMLDEKSNLKTDEIKLPHFIVLKYLLRGYPFDNPLKLTIGYYGDPTEKKFSMSVRYKKKELVKIKDKTFNCHKLEFGLDGVLGTILPELEMWYSVEPPHYLVRYEGIEGLPGSPKRIIELSNRSIGMIP